MILRAPLTKGVTLALNRFGGRSLAALALRTVSPGTISRPPNPFIHHATPMGCQIARHSTRQKYDFSMQEYHKVADEHMDHLLDSLQRIVDDSEGAEDWDVDYNSGVLTLKCGTHGTYVINKQPPNKQIWLSSPTSGPKRYDYYLRDHLSGNAQLSTTSSWDSRGVWFYSRDEKSLHDLLAEELRRILPSLSEDISIF